MNSPPFFSIILISMPRKKPSISNEDIAICAMYAALGTEGVAGMADAEISYDLSQLLAGSGHKGIRLFQGKEGIKIDVFLNVRYGYKIPQIAWDIQENVKHKVEELSGYAIEAVNIHIEGVSFADSEQE